MPLLQEIELPGQLHADRDGQILPPCGVPSFVIMNGPLRKVLTGAKSARCPRLQPRVAIRARIKGHAYMQSSACCAARLPLNTFSVKARSSAEWPHIVKSLPRPFPFFLYPAASTSRVRHFANTAAIRCPHPSMAARPQASACTAPAHWHKANGRSAGRRATLSGFRLCSCRQGPDRTSFIAPAPGGAAWFWGYSRAAEATHCRFRQQRAARAGDRSCRAAPGSRAWTGFPKHARKPPRCNWRSGRRCCPTGDSADTPTQDMFRNTLGRYGPQPPYRRGCTDRLPERAKSAGTYRRDGERVRRPLIFWLLDGGLKSNRLTDQSSMNLSMRAIGLSSIMRRPDTAIRPLVLNSCRAKLIVG